jgi:fructosamine-3-kinase
MEILAVGGGCINECYKVHTSAGQFFIKVNDGRKFPAMFEAEEKGLRLLGDAVSWNCSGSNCIDE